MPKLGRVLRRKARLSSLSLAILPLFLLLIPLLAGEYWLMQSLMPTLAGAAASASFIGLAIGRLIPQAGGASGFGFGGDSDWEGDDAEDGDGDGGGPD